MELADADRHTCLPVDFFHPSLYPIIPARPRGEAMSERLATVELAGLSGAVSLGRRSSGRLLPRRVHPVPPTGQQTPPSGHPWPASSTPPPSSSECRAWWPIAP